MIKVLVTGATGFLGNHVITQLIKLDCEIIATSLELHDDAAKYHWYDKVNYVPADLNKSRLDYFELFGNPDNLIHLAWEGLPNYNELYHVEKNLFNSYFFIKNMVKQGLKNVSVAGTCAEYGMQEGCLNEDMPTMPANSYALAKDSLRKFLEELKKTVDFNLTWLRIFYIYGSGQSSKSLLSQLQKAIKNGEKEFNMSPGDQIRDFIKVEEAANIISNLSLNNADNGIVNCCSGKPVTVLNFVQDYLKSVNYEMKLNLGYYPYSAFEPKAFWGNRTKLVTLRKRQSSFKRGTRI